MPRSRATLNRKILFNRKAQCLNGERGASNHLHRRTCLDQHETGHGRVIVSAKRPNQLTARFARRNEMREGDPRPVVPDLEALARLDRRLSRVEADGDIRKLKVHAFGSEQDSAMRWDRGGRWSLHECDTTPRHEDRADGVYGLWSLALENASPDPTSWLRPIEPDRGPAADQHRNDRWTGPPPALDIGKTDAMAARKPLLHGGLGLGRLASLRDRPVLG